MMQVWEFRGLQVPGLRGKGLGYPRPKTRKMGSDTIHVPSSGSFFLILFCGAFELRMLGLEGLGFGVNSLNHHLEMFSFMSSL